MNSDVIGTSSFSTSSNKYDALLDLRTTDREVLAIVDKVFSGDDSSLGEQNLVTQLLNRRAQKATFVSNAIRLIFDAMSSIIRNIRA